MSTVRTILTVAVLGVAVYGVSIWLHQNGSSAVPDLMLSGQSGSTPGTPGVGGGAPLVNVGTPQPLPMAATAPSLTVAASPSYPSEPSVQPYPSSAPVPTGFPVQAGEPGGSYAQGTVPELASPAPSAATPVSAGCPEFDQALLATQALLQTGQLAEALLQLTQWYGDSRLSPEQAANLMRLLDPLAATVVYSYEYPLDAHHGVQPGETLDQIASHYSVERQTLAKINGLSNQQLQPGQQLKVLQGPFHALVDLSDHELSLVVGGRYAGRFPLSVGQDFPQQEGRYTVLAKTQQPSAAASSGSAGGPSSGYWIALDGSLGFHIAPDPNGIGRTGGPGFLGLREQDLAELFDLLSVGSTVVVRP